MQVHVIHEIDCSVERIDPAVVEAFLDAELSDDPMLADSICAMADAMSAELHPRGVYKLFNPAICTLPPKYTEPAIKLVGTLAVLYGSAAYDRMSEAEHTAMVVSTVGTDEEIGRLREHLVKSDMDALLFDACLEAMASLAADKLAEAVADDAHERVQGVVSDVSWRRAEVVDQHLPERCCVVELGYRKGHLVVPFQVGGVFAAIGRK